MGKVVFHGPVQGLGISNSRPDAPDASVEAHLIALAGGGAMLAHDLVDRRTVDIDLFTPDADEVARLGTAGLRAWGRDWSEQLARTA